MDILVQLRDFVINLVYSFPAGLTSYILRTGLMLGLSSVVLLASWIYLPWRTVFTQTCIVFMTITISLYMPVEHCRGVGKEFMTFFIVISLFCMIFLPGKLSFWLTPRLGNQIRLKKVIMGLVWAGLVLQIIKGS